MKDLKEMVNQHVKESAIIDQEIKQKKEQSSSFINQVFHNLKLIFPAWRQNFKTEAEYLATKELWLNTLIEEGITLKEQIDSGLKAAKLHDSAFFPSIGQFIGWAKKAAPRVNEDAYKEFTYALPEKTKAEYQEIAARKFQELKDKLK